MSRQYTKAELEYAAGIIALTAERNNTSPEEVRLRLKEAIIACYFNADPEARKNITRCPRKGEYPTPEEFMLWTIELARNQLNWRHSIIKTLIGQYIAVQRFSAGLLIF